MAQSIGSLTYLNDLLKHEYTHIFTFVYSVRLNCCLCYGEGRGLRPLFSFGRTLGASFYEILEATLVRSFTELLVLPIFWFKLPTPSLTPHTQEWSATPYLEWISYTPRFLKHYILVWRTVKSELSGKICMHSDFRITKSQTAFRRWQMRIIASLLRVSNHS